MWSCYVIILSLLSIAANAQSDDKSVIIIGAGLSGYATARGLIEKGFTDIKILEALGRTGGRIYSVPFSDGFVDLGAQWCHGQTGNIIYEMTSPHFTFGSTAFETVDPYFRLSNGILPEQDLYVALYGAGYKIIHGIDKGVAPNVPFGELFMQKFNALLATTYPDADPEVVKLVKAELVKQVMGFFAANSWNDISPTVNYEEEKATGDQHCTWKKQGFHTFFNYLTKKAPNPAENLNIDAKVILNKVVTNIQYNKNDANSKVTVTCADDTKYTASHVVFTPSLGYLKAHYKTLFTPALDATDPKAIEIESRGVGNLGKFFMQFSNPFWALGTDPFLGIEGMWLEEDKQTAIRDGREWLLGIVAVYAVDNFPDILEVFLAGDYVRTFENTDNEKIIADVTWWLETFAPYMKPVPRPLAVQKTKWMTNEFFLGSYSYPSMAEERNKVRTSHLAAPIVNVDTKPIVLFAGEATDSKYPSMAHGAVNSGFRAAKEIVNYYLP
ncbi:spermine oxidase-like [Chironomus tepperi]|uniref:spermine oxidase-like n=1 Tax=Chironomus tepperi TaxID=113505 RepID=UPI00391F02CB